MKLRPPDCAPFRTLEAALPLCSDISPGPCVRCG